MNPYESPPLNADKARYDRTLFWRIVKCFLWITAILLVFDAAFSSCLHWTRTIGGNQPGDVLDAIRNFSWDGFRDAIKNLRG